MTRTSHVRKLPAIGRLLDDPALRGVLELYGRDAVRVQAQREIDELRGRILATSDSNPQPSDKASSTNADFDLLIDGLPQRIAEQVSLSLRGLRRVLNATGIVVHTNLGRSPLPADVVEEVVPLLTAYCDLEVDLENGERGERNRAVEPLLKRLCGAEAAIVTNNNAAAMVLILAALAKGREVIVSRGELVEIGGSFRIPDILAAAGARLREVGTTNRTRLADYESAICDDTALLLKVHPSNYRIRGFTEETPATELVELGRRTGLPVVVDEGSGLLAPTDRAQLNGHVSLKELLAIGCDLVCGSGDKLLGGPQAGLLLGRADLVERCRRFPLYRAMRPDRFTFATLEAVLRRRLAGKPMPLDALWQSPEQLRPRLGHLAEALKAALAREGIENLTLEEVEAQGFVGGGSAPDAAVPGPALAIHPAGDELARRLRLGGPALVPVVGYLQEQKLVLDLRTVHPDDDLLLQAAVIAALCAEKRS